MEGSTWRKRGDATTEDSRYQQCPNPGGTSVLFKLPTSMGSESLKTFDEVIILEPNASDARYNKGSVLRELGRYDEAIKSYEEAIRLEPGAYDAWNGKGMALSKQGMYNEAIKTFNEAIWINPYYIAAWFNKGLALYMQYFKS